jgi:hypothetical protein
MDEENIDFTREAAEELYRFSSSLRVNPERWERVREQDFLSLAEEITGQRCLNHTKVRCPFHGTDSTPSFQLYEDNAYCFGCELPYDHISLVQKYLDCNKVKALSWCEEFFDLPRLPDVEQEENEEEEEEPHPLTFQEVRKAFVNYAVGDIQKVGKALYAEDYLRYYFQGKGTKEEESSAAPLLAALPAKVEQYLLSL